MNLAYLLLGSNMGNRKAVISKAADLIYTRCGKVIRKSSLYESEPWGFESENQFINQVILIETTMDAEVLLQNLLNIELFLGRTRNHSINYSSRIIDIDILFFNHEIINGDTIKIPHPLLQERRFTLEPLNEIAADFNHPTLKKKVKELLKECKDFSNVNKYFSKTAE